MKMGKSKRRIVFTQLFAILLIIIQITTTHSWLESNWIDTILEVFGLIFLSIAALGRSWCSLFISGHKTHDLITTGPYSVVRNPLYLFSFIGAIGVGLCSENLLILTILILLFTFYYPSVIEEEEKILHSIHGSKFTDYILRVPRLLPRLSLYECTPTYQVDTRRVLRSFRDSLGFLCVYPSLEIIEYLRSIGHLPVITTIPNGLIVSIKTIYWQSFNYF